MTSRALKTEIPMASLRPENDSPPVLSPAEWEVMKVLWDNGGLAARDVFAALPPDGDGVPSRGWAYRTVKTLLSRLVAKGAIDYQQVGNSYLYRAAAEREAMARQEVRGLLDRLRSHTSAAGRRAVSSVLAQFLGDAELSEEEVSELRAALDRKTSSKQRKRGS